MQQDSSELQQLLDFAVDAARGAGDITLRYFRREVGTYRKPNNTFVTDADFEAEKFLRRRVEEVYPEDSFLGEEGGEREGSSGRRWIVDPIDGTYSFVHGVPFYGVLVGLEIEGQPKLGVINIPALGEIVYAASGTGCFLNGEPARVSQTAPLGEALLLSTDFWGFRGRNLERAAEELQRGVAERRTWGDCYGYVLVATGRADIMIDPAMNVWDCAALLPVVEEAGGTFTDWKGQRTINGGNAIATNGLLYEDVRRVISENIKEST